MYVLDEEGDVADTGVVLSDFGKLLGNVIVWGSIHSTVWIGPGDKEIPLNALGIAEIAANKGGKAKFLFRGSHDINNIPDDIFIENNYFLFAGPSVIVAGQRPRLVIETAAGYSQAHVIA